MKKTKYKSATQLFKNSIEALPKEIRKSVIAEMKKNNNKILINK